MRLLKGVAHSNAGLYYRGAMNRNSCSLRKTRLSIYNQFRFASRDKNYDADLIEEYTIKALTWEMEVYQRMSAERTVPWFLKHMPSQYFQEIDRELQKDHLRALTALTEAGLNSYGEEVAQRMCEFAAKGEVTAMKRLIPMGAHPNVGDYDGRTPIHLAACEGKLDVLKFLAGIRGFNINVVDRFGGTPLTDAIRHEQTEAVQWIRSHGGVEKALGCKEFKDIRGKDIAKLDKGMVELMLKSRTNRYVTFFIPSRKGAIGNFAKCCSQLPLDYPLVRVKGFLTNDYALGLHVFEFAADQIDQKEDAIDPLEVSGTGQDVLKLARELKNGKIVENLEWEEYMDEKNLRTLISGSTETYLQSTEPAMVLKHLKKVHMVIGSDSGIASMDELGTDEENWHHYLVVAVASNVHAYAEMQRIANYLGSKGLSIERFHLDKMKDPKAGSDKCLVRVVVETKEELSDIDIETTVREIPRLKYLDDAVLNWRKKNRQISMETAEVASALGNLVFPALNKEHPHMFSLDTVQKLLEDEENIHTVMEIAKLWKARFDPDNTISDINYNAKKEEIEIEIRNKEDAAQHLLRKLVVATDFSLRTNFFLPKRRSLTIRIDPNLMMTDKAAEVPYGVFFIHSRSMNGFHVRFRDIARGGLRIVPTVGLEHFRQESMRHFDEVYGLALSQQLKNKDIPEGGAKAVCLVNVSDRMPRSRDFLIRKAVRSMADGLLDLTVPDLDVKKRIVDYFGKEELLYLGPDENIIPEDINWVTDRAAYRGMNFPSAFMSSKPDIGINHKVYGVTSEGVAVFLKVALEEAGFNTEKDSFTLKITGGSNGDVAGNMIKILHRDYAGRASIVGMCDHTGGVENESGLDMDELLRLFERDLPLSEYDATKLGPGGQMYGVGTFDDIQLRNTMHNRLKADAFIPAGGRPNTININNYEKYFLSNGSPSAPLIVEAANIFTTPEARAKLGERGVTIVKDSSANKAGVCCSSYEIVSSMLLTKEEFMSVKSELVEDVLNKLRESARIEAELLFREHRANPNLPMVHYSQAISGAINRATDAVVGALKENYNLIPEEIKHRLMVESLPKKLVEVARERLEQLPNMYMIQMVGAKLGSKMVYNEGLEFIDSMSDETLTSLAAKYVHYDDSLKDLMKQVEMSELKIKDKVMKVLKAAGVRSVIDSGI